MENTETIPLPRGELALQTIALPKDTNANGDIFSGWVVTQMDLAGALVAQERAKGRVATVSIDKMGFIRPVPVGSTVSCYAEMLETGKSSLRVLVELWIKRPGDTEQQKVTESIFVFVALDANGRTRAI